VRQPLGGPGRLFGVRNLHSLGGAVVLAALLLTGCDAGATAAGPTTGAGTAQAASASSASAAAALKAGAALQASGAVTGLIEGSYTCRTTGTTTIVTMTAGATSLVVRAVQGKVVEGAFLSVGKDFGGTVTKPGGGGTVTVKGTSATLTGVTIPSRTGGTPLVLAGTVTCH